MGLANALQAPVVALIEGTLEQGHKPGAVKDFEAGQTFRVLYEFGGIRDFLEKLVEVLH